MLVKRARPAGLEVKVVPNKLPPKADMSIDFLIQSIVQGLDTQKLKSVVTALEKEARYVAERQPRRDRNEVWTRRFSRFQESFETLVRSPAASSRHEESKLIEEFKRFLEGSGHSVDLTSEGPSSTRQEAVSSIEALSTALEERQAVLEVAELLVQLRTAGPSLFGSYTKAPGHLRLQKYAFGGNALQDITNLVESGVVSNDMGHPGFEPASAARGVEAEAAALASELDASLPPQVMGNFREALVSANRAKMRLLRRTVGEEQRQNFFERLVNSLGHHWVEYGPKLCRFLKLYDQKAAQACPFKAQAETQISEFKQRLFLALHHARTRYVTAKVKEVCDPAPAEISEVKDSTEDSEVRREAMAAELHKSGGKVEEDAPTTYTRCTKIWRSVRRNLRARMRAEADELALVSIKLENQRSSSWHSERTVFLKNLDPDVRADDLVEALSRCGAVSAVRLFNNATDEAPSCGEAADERDRARVVLEETAEGVQDAKKEKESRKVVLSLQEEARLAAIEDKAERAALKKEFVAAVRAEKKAEKAAEKAAAKEAAKIAKLDAKSKRGRKGGGKSMISAASMVKKRQSDVYAFVEFEREEAAALATSDTPRIFGIQIQNQLCRTGACVDARTLYAYALSGEASSGEMEVWLNKQLAPLLFVHSLQGDTSLLNQVSPNVWQIEFPTHDAAAWALGRLQGRCLERPEPLPTVTFGLQWFRVTDRTVEEEAKRSRSPDFSREVLPTLDLKK